MPRAVAAAVASSAHADPSLLRSSLAAGDGPVELRETHCSLVLLTADRAYKLKKPVRFDFVDQRSQETRAAACRHELAINAPAAPGLGLAVRSVVPGPGGYELAPDGDPRAVDHVVEMRRFDEGRTLRARLERGALTSEDARRAGEAIAHFHRDARRAREPLDHRAVVRRNHEALAPLADGVVGGLELTALRRASDAFLRGWREVLAARHAAGLVIDGHGDLRAEHVLLEEDRVLLVDRLEFDDLRRVDVADELAFLLMDLESRGGGAFRAAVLDGYAAGGGRPQPAALLAFFGAYRAEVRAKVALLRGGQTGGGDGEERARELLQLARRLSWRARGPLTLLVTGPPASGKSTLAAELARVSGLPVLASDELRREGGAGAASYDLAARRRVYERLAARAAGLEAAIVDATFGEPALQEAFAAGLGDGRPLVAVKCVAAPEVRLARARARERRGGSASEAGPEVAAELGARFVPFGGIGDAARLALDTEAPLALQVDEVEAWLDARPAGAGW